MPPTIGFIGLGLMGKPMALNLLKAGYPLVAHSRSAGPVDAVVAAGGTRATSPADVARQATVIITMVPDSPDVEAVLEGPNGVHPFLISPLARHVRLPRAGYRNSKTPCILGQTRR